MNGTLREYGSDDRIIGLSYVFLSLVAILLYLPCLYVMGTDRVLKHHSCLRIMFHLGLADLLQLSGSTICGFWSLTGFAFTVPRWLNNMVINFSSNVGWNSYIVLANCLAFNRFVALGTNDYWTELIFSPQTTTCWISICWLWASLWVFFNLSPYGGMIYYAQLWLYYFDSNAPAVQELKTAVLINCIVNQAMIAIWYFVAITSFRKEWGTISSVSAATRAKERSLLVQAFIICFTLFVTDQYWHNIINWVKDYLHIYSGVLGSYLLIVNSAVNPIIYLTLNKTIQEKVLLLMRCKRMGGKDKLNRVQPVRANRNHRLSIVQEISVANVTEF